MSKSRDKNLKENAKELPRPSAASQELSAGEQRLAAANQQLRASNQELRAREEEIRQVLETAADGMQVIDRDFNVIRANQTLADLVGLAKEEIIGKRCYDVFRCPLCHSQNCSLNRILAGRERFESETEGHRSDGGKIPCILTATAFRRADGEIIGIVEDIKDITVRKQAEEALRALNQELTSTANELEEANRELRDFVYIASHDLREPLRKISSFGELLKGSLRGKLEEDHRENLEFMIDGAERMTQMIEGLLTYSRLNTGQAQLEPVDLNEIVEQLRRLELAAMLEETDGEIEIPQLLPEVAAEPAQVRQLMQNLIANGIKYRRQGIPARIVITAQQLAGDNVRVEVQDNGIGIKDEYQRGIFKMFKRLHSRREYDGAGIGLAVCKKIVEKHKGSIGVESKQGEGSVFWFTLAPAKVDFNGCHCEHLTTF